MTLFVRQNTIEKDYTPTPEQAQAIYAYMENGLDESMIFTKYGISIKTTAIVKEEIKRLEKEVIAIMSNLENQPETQEDLVALVSSETLDTTALVNDVRRYWDGNPDQGPSFADWKALFNSQDELI